LIDTVTSLLSWQAVDNAIGYDVVINGNHFKQESISYNLNHLEVGTYQIAVIAKGDGKLYDDSAPAYILFENKADEAVKLEKPTGLVVANDVLIWNVVQNAEFYVVYINNTPYILGDNSTKYQLSGLAQGKYIFQVQASARSASFLSSDLSDELEHTVVAPPSDKQKLDTPQFSIDTNNQSLSWGEINHASGYAVNIDGNDNKVYNSLKFDLSNLSVGVHAIKLKALGDGGLNYNDSDYSASQNYTVEGQAGALATPTIKLWQDDGFVSWEQIRNASGYTLDIDGSSISINSTTVAYSLLSLGQGSHNIKVKAVGGSVFGDSDWSNTVSYNADGGNTTTPNLPKPETPTGLRVEDGNLYWNSVANAERYMVRVAKVGGSSNDLPVGKGSEQFGLGNYKNGVYHLSVQAQGDNISWGNSDWSAVVTFEDINPNAKPLPTPDELHVEEKADGFHFVWHQDGVASGGWNVEIDGSSKHVWHYDVSLDGVSSGMIKLRVQALPQDTETSSSPSAWAEMIWDNASGKLDAPKVSLDKEAMSIKWDSVDKATEYEVNINGVPYSTKTNSFDLSILFEIKTYSIKVKAKDSVGNTSSSDWSNEIIYSPDRVQIEKPIGYIAEKTLNWYLVNNALGYDIEIDGIVATRVGQSITSYNLQQLTETRTYKLRIMAIGNGAEFLNSPWSNDINFLLTNNPPLTGDTSPDGAVARFEKYFPKAEYDSMFAHRLGTRAWKDDSEAQSYYKDNFDREKRTDFYTYDNLEKAIRTLAGKKLEVFDREGMQYWGSSRVTVIDKLTGQRLVIAKGNPELDAEWNQDKTPINLTIDFGDFLNSTNENDSKRELAAFLANISHETNGGYRGANTPTDRFTYGLFWNEELDFIGSTNSYYQNDDPLYPAVPGHSYHGRGPIQITWNYNYGQFSNIVFLDKNILLEKPELVSQDGALGFMAGMWFWMMPQFPKDSCHNVIMGNYKPIRNEDKQYEVNGTTKHFALTIVIINGGFEAGKGEGASTSVDDRVGYYKTYAAKFGADLTGDKLYTDGFTPWQ